MAGPIHVLGIAGSLRKNSFNKGLLNAACEMLPDGMVMEIYHELGEIPLFNQDSETNPPEAVLHLKERIAAADALLIATPEYNFSVPGVLKNAIDWASRPPQSSPFAGKPLAIMGAGGRLGTARAQYHLRQIAVFLNMHPINKPEVLVQFAGEKFDSNGHLTDQQSRDQIRALLEALLKWTRQLKAPVE